MSNLLTAKIFTDDAEKTFKEEALDFIRAGVGCNCMVALCEAGILEKLTEKVTEQEIQNYSNPLCIQSALVTLEKCKIVEKNLDGFKLTRLGRALSEYIGLITIFFDGYGMLVAQQATIVNNSISNLDKSVKWPIVSKSSIQISEKTLGCGHGVMLSKLCKITGNPGLGFEGNVKTVTEAKMNIAHDLNIQIEVADIRSLQGEWKDVVFLMQAFVFHDITPTNTCIHIMNSYLNNFPNLKYFFYIDMLTPSQTKNGFLPGFDYVHGLLGIPTRTYEETMSMFEQSNYSIFKEVQITDLPNTFLWILCPRNGVNHEAC